MDAPEYEGMMIHVVDPCSDEEVYRVVQYNYRYSFGGKNGKAFSMEGVVRHSCNTLEKAKRFIRDLYPQL